MKTLKSDCRHVARLKCFYSNVDPDQGGGIGVYNREQLSRHHWIDRNISKCCVYDLDESAFYIENYDMF